MGLIANPITGQLDMVGSSGSSGTPSVIQILTSDPVSPVNDTGWLFRDGLSPQSVELHVRIAGVTYNIPLFTLP